MLIIPIIPKIYVFLSLLVDIWKANSGQISSENFSQNYLKRILRMAEIVVIYESIELEFY